MSVSMSAQTSRLKLRAARALLLAGLLAPGVAFAASDPTGVWLNDTGRGAIEIKPCGSALCGHVVWVKDGSDAKGCGRQIIGDATEVRSGIWDNGWIYSPERKKRYDVELKRLDDKRLRVTGYAGSKFFSKTMVWTRADDNLLRCGSTVAAPAAPAPSDPAAEAPVKAETSPPAPSSSAATSEDTPPARSGAAALSTYEARRATSQAATPSATEAAPATTQDKSEEAAVAAADETDPASVPKEEAPSLGNLGGLPLDKYLKRENGKCALDLPWVKVAFDCREK